MLILISLPFIYLFTVGAKLATIQQNESAERLMWLGIPRRLITAVCFLIFPVMIWDGIRYHVFLFRKWRDAIDVKRQVRILGKVLDKISERHGDNPELKEDIKKFKQLLK